MRHKKQYFKGQDITTFVVRLDHYGSQLSSFEALFVEAEKDFPDLRSSDVKIVCYGGKRIKGFFGLEFTENCTPPPGYEQISQLEYTQ